MTTSPQAYFQPRELTHEKKARLDEVEMALGKLRSRLEKWSDEVENSPIGSEERKEAKERETFYKEERDKAQLELAELKVVFGQVPLPSQGGKFPYCLMGQSCVC